MHVVVRAESGITSLEQLAGKKVNFSDVGSGTPAFDARYLRAARHQADRSQHGAGRRDREAENRRDRRDHPDRRQADRLDGQAASAAEGFRILPVPFAKPLQDDYLPATLSHADYPGMVAAGQDVETIAVGAVLIAYNWPKGTDRYRRIAEVRRTVLSRSSPNSRNRRVIRNGAKPILRRRCRAGPGFRPRRSGSTSISRRRRCPGCISDPVRFWRSAAAVRRATRIALVCSNNFSIGGRTSAHSGSAIFDS